MADDVALYIWRPRGHTAHIAAGKGKRPACGMFLGEPREAGTAIPEGRQLCRRCKASQADYAP